jgi:hypothetical protein
MNAEFTGRAASLVSDIRSLEEKIKKLSEMTHDDVLLKKLSTVDSCIWDAANYMSFVAERSHVELIQQERAKNEVIASLQARCRCEEISKS